MADSLWPHIKIKFGPILKCLENRLQPVSDSRLSAAIEEVQGVRDITLNKFQNIENLLETLLKARSEDMHQAEQRRVSEAADRGLADKEILHTKLAPVDYQIDHSVALGQGHDAAPGSWVLDQPEFKEWMYGKSKRGEILYLSGMPGSGKHISLFSSKEYYGKVLV